MLSRAARPALRATTVARYGFLLFAEKRFDNQKSLVLKLSTIIELLG
jgi:hypothetical protein